jgi:2-oxoglutarate dehydrogenase E2 component (dihydrolipoamide succinyltransferase)
MASDIVVPTLGESVTEATVARWLKEVGDAVAEDEPLVELETEKVTLEVNANQAGVLNEVLAEAGAAVEVGALLGRIGEAPASTMAREDEAAKEPGRAAAAEAAVPTPRPAEERARPAARAAATIDIVVPSLGESVTEATIAQWLRQPGEAVEADTPLVELETEKVTLEVNAPEAGSIAEVVAAAGATVEVGALLARFAIAAGAPAAVRQPEAAAGAPKRKSEPKAAGAPAAQPPRPERSLEPEAVRRSGPGGTITKSDVLEFLAGAPLSPAVQKLIDEHGLDPSVIPATGKDGRLTKADVEAYLQRRPAASPAAGGPPAVAEPAPQPPAAERPREERVRMSKLRQTVARRLKEAQNTAAMLTTFNEIDMSATMALRAEHKDGFEKKHGVRLGIMSFFTKAAVKALQELPAVNARIDGDELVYNRFFDIGMAVSTPGGLMVPVLRDCDVKSFAEIEKALADLAARGRDGKLSMDEMQGGTFTITNGGVFGSLLSTPILNMPQAGILGMHKIEKRPVVVDDQVVIRPMMYVALTYDHRIIDGREAVTFLIRVKEAIEDPRRLLLDL